MSSSLLEIIAEVQEAAAAMPKNATSILPGGGRSDCHDFVTVPRAAFTDVFSNPSPRVLTAHCVPTAEADSASRPAPSAPE